MSRLLPRSSLRYLAHHPWQVGLSILGVALGVGVAMAVDLAIESARRGFTVSAETVVGRATHQALAGPGGIPDSLFAAVRSVAGVAAAAPVVDADLEAEGAPGLIRLLGVDPLSEAPFRAFLGGERLAGPAASVLLGSRSGAVSTGTARSLGLAEGDTLWLDVGGRRAGVRIGALIEPPDPLSREGLRSLVLVDIALAQSLLRRDGLDRIDFILRGSDDDIEATLAALRRLLPASASLAPAGVRVEALREMTRAFELNLRALSLLALLFGVFLIYNSAMFSIVQRRSLFGGLRSLGVTRREVLGLVLAESAVLGVVGVVVGTVLGIGLARELVHLVTRTINDLYFATAVSELRVAPLAVARTAGIGLAATLLGALPAAVEASGSAPRRAMLRSELERKARRAVPLVTAGALAVMALGGVVLAVADGVAATFGGLLAVILGCGLLTPAATVALMRGAAPMAERIWGVLGRLATGGVVDTLSRTAPAIAALTIAIAVAVGVGVMIDSFRGTLANWLEVTLQADVYVSPPQASRTAEDVPVAPGAVARIRALPQVRAVRLYRRADVDSPLGAVQLLAVTPDSVLRRSFILEEGRVGPAWRGVMAGGGVLVSEPFASRHRVGAGDTLRLATVRGLRPFPIHAVYRDYGSERGTVLLSRDSYRRHWADDAVSSLAVLVAPGADATEVAVAVEAAAAPVQALSARSNRVLREQSLRVFDRTFVITAVLRMLALVAAFVGVLGALMALQLERARELGVLRATGITPGQLWRLVVSQTGLMGLTAGLFALPVGLVVASLMVHVVNRRSFGWTIDMRLDAGLFLEGLLVALAASVLAGLYPAFRMARTRPAIALREDW